jgi:hypothetical protein
VPLCHLKNRCPGCDHFCVHVGISKENRKAKETDRETAITAGTSRECPSIVAHGEPA